jgi:hypothetical protein
MMSKLHFSTRIIEGQLVRRQDKRQLVPAAAGVSLAMQGKMAWLKVAGRSILLRAIRFVVRPSGRLAHLSRYLVGIGEDGVVWEVFLERVRGVRERLFQVRRGVQRGLMRLIAAGFNPRQALSALILMKEAAI